jgi:outer membrane protein insertion porin family
MKISSAAIYTLTTLAIANLGQQALAANPKTPITKTKGDIIIPVVEETTVVKPLMSSPETIDDSLQFSQKSAIAQRGNSNNSSIVIPVSPPETSSEGITIPTPKSQTPKSQTPKSQTPKSTNSPSPIQIPKADDSNLFLTVTDLQIVGATEELNEIINETIKTQAGGQTSQTQLQKDVAAILETDLFVSARVNTTNTPAGLKVVFQVQPVIVKALKLNGAKALNYQAALNNFQSAINKPISPAAFKQGAKLVNKWYDDNGYRVARVISIAPSKEGILTLNVAEGVVGDIKFRFLNEDGNVVDSKGKPIKGRSQTDYLRKQLKIKSGDIFKDDIVQKDIQQLYALGLFESVNLALEGDANKVDIVYDIREVGAKNINVGGNYSADQGVIGNLNYNDLNFGGVKDNLGLNLQLSARDLQFDGRFSSSFNPNDPERLGYSIRAFRKSGLSQTFDDDIKLVNGDKVREGKVGASFTLNRPLDGWDTSLGLNYTRTSLRDRAGNTNSVDANGNPLTLSGNGIDDLTTLSFTASKDKRDNVFNPTNGSVVKLTAEQSIPIGQGSISMNRIQANYSQFVPVKLFNSKDPQVLAVNLQGGAVFGDLPPYEAFNLGGPNSVRGYGTNDLASARNFVLASAEYRFPVVQSIGGVLFADFASDLGSSESVLGQPGVQRGKPGSGFGLGAGVRFQSPIGLLRADYGITDQGDTKLQFAIGQRF